MREEAKKIITKKLEFIYEGCDSGKMLEQIDKVAEKYNRHTDVNSTLSEKDVMVITYGDSIKDKGEKGFATLNKFFRKYVKDAVSTIHLLPMFTYTSDDGFSVVDYKEINPDLGGWDDVNELSKRYGLMIDAVVNHISKSSKWFQNFLKGEEPYTEYFIECDKDADYSSVTRPRALPLLTEFDTANGKKYVWTTFSDDQIDLNFKSEKVFLEILDVLFDYAANGAKFIRLDAIGFMWKELGTTCMHLSKTHEIIKVYRAILEEYMPGTKFITETNVPHQDNISYFGDGDEAHLVYQFPLPPLTMFSILTQNAEKLTKWAIDLGGPLEGTTYFNFLSSHDGIGVRPVEGILTREEQQVLIDATLTNGGVVSYKDNGDGTKSPYELNINYQDALASPEDSDELRIQRFLAAETILLSLQGVPGIYIHSLLGSRNDYYGMETSGIPRRINREKLDYKKLEQSLSEDSNRKKIFDEMIRRLNIRRQYEMFSPLSHQTVLSVDKRVFALERFAPGSNKKIKVLVNVSLEEVNTEMKCAGIDLLSGEEISSNVTIKPLQCMWILEKGNYNN